MSPVLTTISRIALSSPMGRVIPSPVGRVSPSPLERVSPSPVDRVSPSPVDRVLSLTDFLVCKMLLGILHSPIAEDGQLFDGTLEASNSWPFMDWAEIRPSGSALFHLKNWLLWSLR